MATQQENAAELTRLITEIRGHRLCVRFEDTGSQFRVDCPPGYALTSVEAGYHVDTKALALSQVLAALERLS